ncbi:unnamed protein product [Amoebophrya sp. A120]|nr:unnamed protein product [Amoebophrya sp. A120]|eukprot:GSA120T00005025001.1
MHSGQYDKDCTTWSPQGDIPQIRHACAAVTNGTVIVGLCSNKYGLLAGFKKKQQSEFSSYDEKLFKIDDHCGIAIAGLTADARVLADYMRSECLEHKYVYDGPMNVGRLVSQIGDKAQMKTLQAGKRPYGVGLLIQGYQEDLKKAAIYETSPSGDFYEYKAMAIGGRAQPAKTYLEKHFETFPEESLEKLIGHAVKAIHVTIEQDTEMTTKNIDVSIVGPGMGWKLLSEAELQPYVTKCNDGAAPAAAAGGDAMDTSG